MSREDAYNAARLREQRESMRRAAAMRHPEPRIVDGIDRYTSLPEPEPEDLARRVERLRVILGGGEEG